MGHLDKPMPSAGPAMTPADVLRALRWVGDLRDEEVIRAIQTAAETDLAAQWPELGDDDLAELREQSRDMTRSRMQTWKTGGERRPTWLEIRALISGLSTILA